MAIYHLSAQIIKRSAGRSAIAAAAYRAGERLVDRESGAAFDYRNKGGIVHTEIRTPGGAPDWMQDREELWNVLEFKNRRKDAQLAREMNIALPREMDLEQQKALLRRFVDEQFVDRGMVADMAIHHDEENNNPHAHVMLSFYAANENGFRRTRTREWNSKDFLTDTREAWSQYANRALEAMGREERIDHRTLEAQGIDRMPTIHEGPQGRKARERGFDPQSNVVDIQTYAGKRRSLDYREIDVGRSRAAQNQRIHAFNERQATKRLVEAMDAVENWLRHRFLEATIKRAGTRLRDARRSRRMAEGSVRYWQGKVKERWRLMVIASVFGSPRSRAGRTSLHSRLYDRALRRLKQAKRDVARSRRREITAERDYRQAKLVLGRDRKERLARRQRSVSRWTSAIDRIAPQDIRLDRLPEHQRDARWGKVMGWVAKAAEVQRQQPVHAANDQHVLEHQVEVPSVASVAPSTEVQEPSPVETALSARAEMQRQDHRLEALAHTETRIMRLERMVRRGEAAPEALAQAKAEQDQLRQDAGGNEAWQRQAELRGAYSAAIEQLDVDQIEQAEISEEECDALTRAKALREEQRQRQSMTQGHGLRHKIEWEPPD
ncbi:MAG: MobQ family relaxase [Pontimonas sp.]